MRRSSHILGLAAVAVFCGIGLDLMTCFGTWLVFGPGACDFVRIRIPVGSLGAMQGLIAAPPVMVLLWRKGLRPTWWLIYGPAFLVAFVTGVGGLCVGLVGTLLLPIIAVWVGCARALRNVPERRRTAPGHCVMCDYNLRGNVSGACPECGTSITENSEEDQRRHTTRYWGAAVIASVVVQLLALGLLVRQL